MKARKREGNIIEHPALSQNRGQRKKVKRLHHYTPGSTPDVMLSPRTSPDSIPSRTAVPPPSPTSPPLSMGFDDSGSSMDPYKNMSGVPSDADYYDAKINGLGDWSDIFTTAFDAYKSRQAADAAKAQAATAQAQAAQAAALRSGGLSTPGLFLGLSTTTWLMIAGGGLGAYLLLSRKKKRR